MSSNEYGRFLEAAGTFLQKHGPRSLPILGATVPGILILSYPVTKMLGSDKFSVEVCGVIGVFFLSLVFLAAFVFSLLVKIGFFPGTVQALAFERSAEGVIRDHSKKMERGAHTEFEGTSDQGASTDVRD